MKSFLDRFRRKGPEEDEGKKPETACDMAAAREPAISGRAGPVPRESASAPAVTSTESPAGLAAAAGRKEETITFELGDFLQRIPEQLLSPGDHDPKTQLVFDVGELSARI